MEPDRRDEWAARVAAWHQRDPLALRVTPQQVSGFAWLDLPFAGGGPRSRWQPVFSERVLADLPPARLAAWARRHGHDERPAADGLPLHQVEIDRARVPAGADAVVLWMLRATLETAAGPVEVLLDARPGGAVLGRRRRSPRRVAVAAAGLTAALALAAAFAWIVHRGRDKAAPAAPPVASAASAAAAPPTASAPSAAASSSASAVSAASAAAPAPSAASAAASAPVPAASAAPPPARASAAAAPLAEAPARPATMLPPPVIAPRRTDADGRRIQEPPEFLLDDTQRRAARAAGESARAASAARRAERQETAYALVTRPARTPTESRLLGRDLEAAMAALPGPPRCPRLDVMPAGDDWRAVCWPLTRRDEAERLRDRLVKAGQRIELIEF
ncbi:hypothetical protein LOC51_15020 [Rubrivivax sp. JA1024]|uniref:hypothetical protein n=1 Tax=Rubrivivax sp. JA1026 TaxID=2710888 RepID=UPI0013E91E5D|nr:hypothetical protein [Rubrivivax sp. JA1026]MCD0418527.1 hypothetical protein [Rubrivivax sp. JA1024]